MKSNLCFIILTLLTTNILGKDRDCGKFSENWRISACASGLKQANLISDATYVEYLLKAIIATNGPNDFYGAGMTTGLDTQLVIGKMSTPVLSSGLSFNYHPSSMYYERHLVDLGVKFDRPVALFTIDTMGSFPEWTDTMFMKFVPTGSETRYAAFRAGDGSPVNIHGQEHCADFTKWVDSKLPEKKQGLAIHMSQTLWCPVLKDGIMEIVVAKLNEEHRIAPNGESEKVLIVEWAIWGSGAYGDVPEEYDSVFY
ncbi:putative capsid protein [Wuhan flea virus]|uniref:putative capsid protein n=1 Tax=Wuhan flea virus TaxID=1746071 RepID=UPI0007064A2A|nr:putative capsid protein [Wuhan flea virus]ALL52914.1 putative capsid protein [Wuhan flea virus]